MQDMLDTKMVAAAAAGLLLLAVLRRRCPATRHRIRDRPRILHRSRPLTTSQPAQFSVVSYNVLCDRFATPRRLPHVYPQFLSWEHRWPRLRNELAAFDADIICLQEVTLEKYEDLQQAMQDLGYAAALQDKGSVEFALAIFFKTDKFRLAWQECRSRALLVELESVEPDIAHKRLWVVNLHLEGSPYRPNDRISQLKHALHRLQLRQGGAAPSANVVITGDFNSVPGDAPYLFLKRGRLDRGATEAYLPQVPVTTESIGHPYALQEAYEAARATPPFTRKVNHHGSVMDFIWCSRHLQVAAVMRPLQLEHRDLVDRCFLPNRHNPSDHLPVGAIISWAQQDGDSNGTIQQ